MSESDYIDVLNKPFIYAIELVVYAKARQVWYTYILGSSDIWSDVNRDKQKKHSGNICNM